MSSTYPRHAYFTEIPQKSYDACIVNDDPKILLRLLFALIVDPDEAKEAFSELMTKRDLEHRFRMTGLDFRWFQQNGSSEADRLLLTLRQWVLEGRRIEDAFSQITMFDVRLGMWVACEVSKQCFVYRNLFEMQSILTKAQSWATGGISPEKLEALLDEATRLQLELPFGPSFVDAGPESVSIATGGDASWQGSEASSVARRLISDVLLERSGNYALIRDMLRDPPIRAKAEAVVATRVASALLRFPR